MALTAARTKGLRKRFDRTGSLLVDRTQSGHTTIIHGPLPDDSTAEVVRRIEAGDFRELAPLLSVAEIRRVRPVLLAKADAAPTLEPNLAQALALLGGVKEGNILQRHLRQSRTIPFASLSEEDQQRVIHVAHSLLTIRASSTAAKLLTTAVQFGSSWTKEVAAGLVSRHLIARPALPVARVLLRVLPRLLRSDDGCFVSAFPILFQRHYASAHERGKELLQRGSPAIRRHLVTTLTTMPYYGLELLMEAFRRESQLDVRLAIGTAIAPALSQSQLEKLARVALGDLSPAIRLHAVELLQYLDGRLARTLSQRSDPDPAIDAALRPYRFSSGR